MTPWLTFAGCLHARSLGGWRGTRGADTVIGRLTITCTIFAVNFWSAGLHASAGTWRRQISSGTVLCRTPPLRYAA